jgi:hypothetical protein
MGSNPRFLFIEFFLYYGQGRWQETMNYYEFMVASVLMLWLLDIIHCMGLPSLIVMGHIGG